MSNENGGTNPRLEEFKALRDEILKRIDTRERIMQANLILLAAILTIAIENNNASALVYPPIAAILTLIWEENEFNIRLLVVYIRTNLEISVSELGWEKWVAERRKSPICHFKYMLHSHYVLFLIGQIITLKLGESDGNENLINISLYSIVAVLIIGLIFVMMGLMKIPEDCIETRIRHYPSTGPGSVAVQDNDAPVRELRGLTEDEIEIVEEAAR